jgi:acyl carrier protein
VAKSNRINIDEGNSQIEEVKGMVAEKVKNSIIAQLNCKMEMLTPESSFVNDLGADELDMITILMEIEGEFNIEIPEVAANQLETVGQLIAYIEQRLKNG